MSNEEVSQPSLQPQSSSSSNQRPQIKTSTIVGNYKLEKTIGEGTFGKVKLALHLPTQEYVAIKILEKSKIHDQEELVRVEKEIKYLKLLIHPNIIQIYEIIENSKNFYLVMEYANGGELFNYIVKNEKITENESSYFFSQIIHGIEQIHKHKICHRDIKPENLLLTDKKILKIIDFGLSNEYEKYLSTPCGSPCYASPEMIHGIKYNGLSVDLWASGVILYAMVCGYLPFDDQDNEKLFAKILQCKIDFPPDEETALSAQCKNLITRILTPNPMKRINLEEIKAHPFLTYGNQKYSSSVTDDNFTHSDLVIERMMSTFDCTREDIVTALDNNRHNNLTTMFKLFKKKYIEGRFYDGFILKGQGAMSKLAAFNQASGKKATNASIELKNKKKISGNKTPHQYIPTGNRSMIEDLDNAISGTGKLEQGNIIIINNTNMIAQPVKMNPLYTKLIGNKGIKQRKIDTSVSIDKAKRARNYSKPGTPVMTSNYKRGNDVNTRNIRKLNHQKLMEEIEKGKITKRATSDESKTPNTGRIYKSKFSPDKVLIDKMIGPQLNKDTSSNASTIKSTNDTYVPTTKKPKHKMHTLHINPNIRINKKDYSPCHIHTVTDLPSGHSPLKRDLNAHNDKSPYQRKHMPTTFDNIKGTNAIYQKKKQNKDNQLITFQKPKGTNFVLCTSQLAKKDIETKLIEYCNNNLLSIFLETGTHLSSRYIISMDTLNKFVIDISTVDDCRMLKLFHQQGQEDLTKDVIRKIVVNVGF